MPLKPVSGPGMISSSKNQTKAENSVEAAEQWLDLYGDALFRYALKRTRIREVAEDLVQETLLAGIKAQDTFRGHASVSTWLFAILRRKLCDHFRQCQRPNGSNATAAPLDESGSNQGGRHWDDDPATICQNTEFQATFESCLAKLPDKLADVFVMRELNQYALGEIREQLGISATTLSMRLHRCRQALRECLNQNWFQSE